MEVEAQGQRVKEEKRGVLGECEDEGERLTQEESVEEKREKRGYEANV